MDPKLTILCLLIGTIIGLSHHGDENLAKMKRQFPIVGWRNIALVMFRSMKSSTKI
jgi:hypothetical protein